MSHNKPHSNLNSTASSAGQTAQHLAARHVGKSKTLRNMFLPVPQAVARQAGHFSKAGNDESTPHIAAAAQCAVAPVAWPV